MASRDYAAVITAKFQRARDLKQQYPVAAELLDFYAKVVKFQSGIVARAPDFDGLPLILGDLVDFVRLHGPVLLREAAGNLDAQRFRRLLVDYWDRRDTKSPESFFARMVLQPYAATCGTIRPVATGENLCPRCGHLPQVGVFRPQGNGRTIMLVCSLCGFQWGFRRICCPGCCERGKKQLEFYSAEELPDVQTQICLSCKQYILIVDASRNTAAVPLVDELAALPLDLWSRQRGFEKVQPNIAGI